MTLVGAAVTPKPGQSWRQAIAEFERLTGRIMPVRRSYDGVPPSSIAASTMRYDLGVRHSVWSIKPTPRTPRATLKSLATSIAAIGHSCDLIIHHEPVDNMTGPEFTSLYQRSAPPFRAAGISVGVCYTNWSCNLPYSNGQSALRHYWPGDSIVDFIAIDEYPIGEITATRDAVPMAQRTRRVTQFADARDIPLGLAEYGVDGAWNTTKAERWLRSVTDWARLRQSQNRPLRWMCYFNSDIGGDWWLANEPQYVDAYTDSYQELS